MHFLYNILIYFSTYFLKGAAFFSPKMRLFMEGRKGLFAHLGKKLSAEDKTIWFHCASLGEYEQGLPVMQLVKKSFPQYKILVTFFSPSGYEVKKNTPDVDIVSYLPLDTIQNAKKFINLVNPAVALFVKYEFWPNYLRELKSNDIPTLLISGIFRKEQVFFKPYGFWMRKLLTNFNHFFVQDERSSNLIRSLGLNNITISGDTRYDRVSRQIEMDNSLPFAEEFIANKLVVIFGSTWPEDEVLFTDFINKSDENIKFIIAPHNIVPAQIDSLRNKITKKCFLYSERESKQLQDYQVIIINTIGLLTKLYSYGDIAYVGGAMGTTGLHNILEPATFGIPVIIGKNHKKFPEATALRKRAGLFSVQDTNDFEEITNKLVTNKHFRQKTGLICEHFIHNQTGASEIILKYLFTLQHIKSNTPKS